MSAPLKRDATYADLEAVPEHLVAEIIDGVLETRRFFGPRPAVATTRLMSELWGSLVKHVPRQARWGLLTRPEVHLGRHVLVPTLAGWRPERFPAISPDDLWMELPPDWACEVLIPATAEIDRGAKARIYAEHGVGHLWLLDPAERTLEVFERAGRQWLLRATVRAGETVQAPPFDAISFPLDDLFPFDTPLAAPAPEA